LDERGFFRVHQFNKIEQIVFCKPDQSPKFFEELAKNAEQFLSSLGIPFRTVNVCTGDIGILANKKFDIEGWSPREGKYIELMSCSNCTDYQARRANTKFLDSNGEKKLVHTLNSTMVASTRFLRIALENWQTKDGKIKIPKLLWPYMNGKKEIGFSKPKKPTKTKIVQKSKSAKRKRKK
jgi:seryl-tRNA synthetase